MAVVSGGTAFPIKFNTLQVNGLYDYDLSTVSATSAKYFDNATNYTLFKGSGFTFDSADVPTGGTVTSVRYVINSSTALLLTGLSIAATAVHDFASQNNTQGLLSLALSGADTLNGTPFADVLSGYAGNDILKGAGGKDVLDGGAGTDTALYTDKTGAVVVALKAAANATVTVGGVAEDTIRNIENITGGSGADTLTGDRFANVLNGGAGNDTLRGGGGADTLIGGRGNDFLNGNSGSDTVDYSRDAASGGTRGVIVNLLGNGTQGGLPADTAKDGFGNTDTVTNIPNVIGTKFNDQIYGGNHANALSGGAGNDLINGGLGKDVLTGGAGNDTFFFNSALGPANIDTISDFVVANDAVRLENAVFTALSVTGVLADAAFHIGTAAADASDRIIYDAATGAISYDKDGTGAAAAVQFAAVAHDLVITNADFFIV